MNFEGDSNVQTIPVTLLPLDLVFEGVLAWLVLVLNGRLTLFLCSDNFCNFVIIAPKS